jgi:hypothetical protein
MSRPKKKGGRVTAPTARCERRSRHYSKPTPHTMDRWQTTTTDGAVTIELACSWCGYRRHISGPRLPRPLPRNRPQEGPVDVES